MSELFGPITATFSIVGDTDARVDSAVRQILRSRQLEPRRVHARRFGERTFVTVEQPDTNEAEAEAVLSEVKALTAVRSAILEYRLERRPPPPKLHPAYQPERIDVV